MEKQTQTAKQEDAMDTLWGEAADPSRAKACHLQWLRDDKYSMFIHWGLYSYLGGVYQGKTYHGIGEWIMHDHMAGIPVDEYKTLAADFNPVHFDAEAIVGLACKAGMRCIVITAKHHEGFAMFDSAASDFTITRATPFQRDPMKELAVACAEAGIRLGFYYSQFQDWVEPDAGRSPDFDHYFERKVIPQVTELLSNYGPVSVVWFDTPGSMSQAHSQRLVDLVENLQPGCLVNSRVGNGLGHYSTLGDMEIPTRTPEGEGLYEAIDTTNDSWAWSRHDTHWKPPRVIVQSLVRTVARGCCFMLNIGPKDDGSVPEQAVNALETAGAWVRDHAEAVYGTTASPFPPFSWGDCTVRGHNLYLHLFEGPADGDLLIAGLKGRVLKAVMMGSGEIGFSQQEDILRLRIPKLPPGSLASVVCLTLDAPPEAAHQDLTVDGNFETRLRAESAALDGVTLKQERWMESFGDHKSVETLTDWTGPDASASWPLQVLSPGPYTVQIDYACAPEADGTEWILEAGGESLLFLTLDSGLAAPDERNRRRMRLRTVELGQIVLNTPGHQELSLRPAIPMEPCTVWISRITLNPWR